MSLEAELHLVFGIPEGVLESGCLKGCLAGLILDCVKDMVNSVCVYKCVSMYVYFIDIFPLLISPSFKILGMTTEGSCSL